MNKGIKQLILTLSLCAAMQCGAQLTSKKVFIEAPFDVIPTLPQLSRLDMIDYFEGGITKAVPTLFNDEAIIKALEDNHINVTTSESSAVDLYTTAIGNDSVIVFIETMMIPAQDSKVTLYDTEWNVIETLDGGTLEDWITPEASKAKKLNDTMNTVSFMTSRANFDPMDGILTFVSTIDETLTQDDFTRVKDDLKQSREFKIGIKGFKPIERK